MRKKHIINVVFINLVFIFSIIDYIVKKRAILDGYRTLDRDFNNYFMWLYRKSDIAAGFLNISNVLLIIIFIFNLYEILKINIMKIRK